MEEENSREVRARDPREVTIILCFFALSEKEKSSKKFAGN